MDQGHGSLLAADVDALVNTVNTVGIMGKGIALQFKRAFPANYRAYQEACVRNEVQLGQMFVFDSGLVGPRRYIINFPTKQHWRSKSNLHDIESGLDAMIATISKYHIKSVAIPGLGCGNGGLAWTDVRPLIEAACDRMPGVRSVVFAPDGAPTPESMPNAIPRPTLTLLRALLLVAIDRYLDRARIQEVREGISELEIQKLAYFLQEFGAPLKLRFTRGRYGPYSDGLTHVLDTLEGHYITGLGDRTAPVTSFAPINTTHGSVDSARELLAGKDQDLDLVEQVLALVDGFETPYSLELLATVHFAAKQEPVADDPAVLIERVAGWSLRKARLFTDRHVRLAAERLRRHRLLPA